MKQRSRQSDFIESRSLFEPGDQWTRISFLDLIGDAGEPIHLMEPAYVHGETVIAVWPSSKNYEAVVVKTWIPDRDALELLHKIQVDWPAALSDVRVRRREGGHVDIMPYPSNLARSAARSTGELGRRVKQILERDTRLLGRALMIAV